MDDHAYSKNVTGYFLNTHVHNISLFSVDGLFLKERCLIHADLEDQNHIFDPGNSFGVQENLANDSGTNLFGEGGMMRVSRPNFRPMNVMGSHYLKAQQ
ncbi:hypothetical protein PVK06_040773 [Gossypium arboreum]|uniref:Uncharacterized protein n=1 Tax=Gossypium arboreum TaxID=29729 RepID=A0ABR0N6C7_GOSAR|nr:hypothetical protein PVK06_040773 [Gossypium arboreum]